MDDLYTILIFVAFVVYSLYKNFNKAAKKKASSSAVSPTSSVPVSKPAREIFETLFGEQFDIDEPITRQYSPAPAIHSGESRLKKYSTESLAVETAFKPPYNDMNRPKTSSLKTIIKTDTKSTENTERSIISALFHSKGDNLRKAIIYQTILERPYI
jgi:hypothetical protein